MKPPETARRGPRKEGKLRPYVVRTSLVWIGCTAGPSSGLHPSVSAPEAILRRAPRSLLTWADQAEPSSGEMGTGLSCLKLL